MGRLIFVLQQKFPTRNKYRIIMEIYEFNCVQCGGFVSVNEVPRRGNICFKCHVRTVRIGFTHGQDNFHGETIRERQNKILSDAAAEGRTVVPASEYGI